MQMTDAYIYVSGKTTLSFYTAVLFLAVTDNRFTSKFEKHVMM